MIITLITSDKLTSITLPEKAEGQYWLKDLISMEGSDDDWYLKANHKVGIIDYSNGREEIKKTKLVPLHIYHIYKKSTMEEMIIFTEPVTDDRQEFKKITLDDFSEIIIGRNTSNDFIYSNQFASSKHAKLQYQSGRFYLQDLNSTNGTFLNRRRVEEEELEVGDIIFIMGLKIIIGIDFIAYNNPDGKVELNSPALNNYIPRKYKKFLDDREEEEDYEEEEEFFTRSPRFKREIETANFNLTSAPKGQNPDDTPAILTFGPSLTMGMGSMISAVTSLATFQIPAAITSLGMLAGSLGFPAATRKYQEKLLKEREELRKEKFTEYLNQVKEKIREETDKQKEILQENFITTRECAKRINHIDRSLWERTREQNDFLKLRIGVGDTTLEANINYQKRDFDLDSDSLNDQVQQLAEAPKVIKDVPIILSFYQAYMSGIIGQREKVVDFVKGLILQLVTYYGYDEVKLVFIYDEEEEESFEFVKWLPHTWNNEKTYRFIATTEDDVKEVSTYLDKEINQRIYMADGELKESMPYYVIFALSRDLSIRSDIVKRLTSIKKNINMSLITCFDELKFVPKECSAVIELEESSRLLNKYDITGSYMEFHPDIMIHKDLMTLSKKLANIKLDLAASGDLYELPTTITFLEMYKVGKVEHLNILTRWKNSDSTRSLKAPIGVNTNGNTFYLDLHERFEGPHALVAGMTGSGKSEFLITYVLSLALNYHPNDVGFLLIDYKGGGMAKALEHLPHVVGIITNLDGSETNRALQSIESEIIRRQDLFNKAYEKARVSNINIDTYQKLYREGRVEEPLQHLFIIADEFAELKTQQPDFMETLISASRIGRSLGIHLILATQKPSGIVDDQIWGNARTKICLKVQDKSDSNDMLKRDEAAEIIETGRFYRQVGYNESFELGQSAWAGEDYIPQDKVLVQKNESIKIVNEIGQVVKEGTIENKNLYIHNDEKQMDAILNYIIKIVQEENISVRALWKPSIPKDIYLEDIENEKLKHEIAPLIGEYDAPRNQARYPLHIPLSKGGNLAIYGMAGSGQTMFIKTMVYSLIKDYAPEDVGIYIFDFDDETLGVFSKAPHVGDVVFSNDKEKVKNLFRLLQEEFEQRKKMLVEYNGDIDLYNDKSTEKMPRLFTIIHNYDLFKDSYEENDEEIETSFKRLAKEGNKYGIYFVVTTYQSTTMYNAVGQSFKQQISLRQKETTDYSSIIENANGVIPAEYEGRGLIKLDGVYEFQTAHITKEENEMEYIRNYCMNLTSIVKTKKIPILPELVDRSVVEEYITDILDKVPVGVNVSSLKVSLYDFKNNDINIIFRDKRDSYKSFIKSIIRLYRDCPNYKTYVIDRNNEWEVDNVNRYIKYEDIIQFLKETQDDNVERFRKVDKKENNDNKLENKVIIINSIASIKEMIEGEEDNEELLDALLNNIKKTYNITVIIMENSRNARDISSDSWFVKKFDNTNAIWLGKTVDDYVIELATRAPKIMVDLKEEFGYVIENGIPSRVKLLKIEEEEV